MRPVLSKHTFKKPPLHTHNPDKQEQAKDRQDRESIRDRMTVALE